MTVWAEMSMQVRVRSAVILMKKSSGFAKHANLCGTVTHGPTRAHRYQPLRQARTDTNVHEANAGHRHSP